MKKILLSLAVVATAGALNAQILTANDSTTFSTWTTADLDQDGNDWQMVALSGGTALDAAGECMVSNSYDNAASLPLTPDNLLISPMMNCSAESNVYVSWTTGNPETTNNWWEEHYAVYIVTDLVALMSGTFPTPVYETTLPVGGAFIWESHDVTAQAAGQATVYLVFRHYDCTDENWMIMDDVVVSGTASIGENDVMANVYPNPASDVLNVNAATEISSVSIIGMDGKVVSTQSASDVKVSVDIASLNAGVYFYEVTTTTGVIRDTFVKK